MHSFQVGSLLTLEVKRQTFASRPWHPTNNRILKLFSLRAARNNSFTNRFQESLLHSPSRIESIVGRWLVWMTSLIMIVLFVGLLERRADMTKRGSVLVGRVESECRKDI
jgi:hypothetical protein